MTTVFNPAGFIVFVLMLIGFGWAARVSPLAAMSLPCMMLLTGLIYFYLMPLVFLAGGQRDFFGLVLDNLGPMYFAVGLYAFGAMVAFFLSRRVLARDPLTAETFEQTISPLLFWGFMGTAILGVAVKVVLGRLHFGGDDTFVDAEVANVNFLELTDSLLIALTIVALLRDRYRPRSLILLAFTSAVFLTDGFRFRLVILFAAAVIAFALVRRIRLRTPYVIGGAIVAIALLNAMGLSRRYGRGLDLTQIQDFSFSDLFLSFGGEVGPTFVLLGLTKSPYAPTVGFEPWTVALARFVPSFIWPDKPYPTYAFAYTSEFPDPAARLAGVAATQQTEFFIQFGWIGLPVLSFLFFMLAISLQNRVNRLAWEARIAGTAIIPPLFGFYAQQRGYTFQMLCELMFTLGPLFFISVKRVGDKSLHNNA